MPELKRHWEPQICRYGGFKIGIAWKGNSRYLMDKRRSIPLHFFADLARIPGICLFSLQKGEGREQLPIIADQFRVVDLGSGLDETSGAFMDTAAVMKNLDLVISPDTAITHLAGALGVPVWLALSSVPDWRWMLQPDDSPWYPTLRIFRQRKLGDWQGVFERMAQQLSGKMAPNIRQSPIMIEVSPGELIDRITILQIKNQKTADEAKLRNIRTELEVLQTLQRQQIVETNEIAVLVSELEGVNQGIWDLEEKIRLCEKAREFGPPFIDLARSVYQHNDRRCLIKRRINELLGSKILEEKIYPTQD